MINQNEQNAFDIRQHELIGEALEKVVGGAGTGRQGRIMGKVIQKEGKTVYTVGLGDTLKNIADYFQTTKETILANNVGTIQNEAMLFPGTELIIC